MLNLTEYSVESLMELFWDSDSHVTALAAELQRRLERLEMYEAALKRISTEHIDYYDSTIEHGSYGTGVVDGHRCAAKIASEALENNDQ